MPVDEHDAPTPGAETTNGTQDTPTPVTPDANAVAGAESSTVPTPDANAEASSTPEGAEPKADTSDKPKRNLADVVQDAFKVEKPAEESAASPEAEVKPETETAEADADKAQEEAEKEFHKHPAWQRIMSERDQYKAKIDELSAYEPAAKQYEQITKFMETNAIPAEEMAEAMTLVAMMKKPESLRAAVDKLSELRDQGLAMLGEGIDTDLRQQVEEGALNEAYAKELTKQRAEARVTRASAEQATSRAEAANTQLTERQTSELQTQAKSKAEAYLTQKKSADPDFDRKAPMLKRVVQSMRAEHKGPLTPDAAEKIMSEAYDFVTDQLTSAARQPKPTPRTPTGNTPGSAGTAPKPKSLSEAISLGMSQGTAA